MRPCKLWTGAKYGTGYGKKWIKGEGWMLAHRYIFQQDHGYLPPVVRHDCDTPLCVELTHLLPGTQADNMRDMFDRGRHMPADGTCRKGHNRWGVNSTTGNRKCLECQRLWNIESRRRRRVDA
jgi:hypothetical protein